MGQPRDSNVGSLDVIPHPDDGHKGMKVVGTPYSEGEGRSVVRQLGARWREGRQHYTSEALRTGWSVDVFDEVLKRDRVPRGMLRVGVMRQIDAEW